jgi:hypothetical protein
MNPEEMMPVVVDEDGRELAVDEPEPEPALPPEQQQPQPQHQSTGVATGGSLEAQPEKEQSREEDHVDEEEAGFMRPDQLHAAAKSGRSVEAIIKKRKPILEIRRPPAAAAATAAAAAAAAGDVCGSKYHDAKRSKKEGGLGGVKTMEELLIEAEAKVAADLQRLLGGSRFGSQAGFSKVRS